MFLSPCSTTFLFKRTFRQALLNHAILSNIYNLLNIHLTFFKNNVVSKIPANTCLYSKVLSIEIYFPNCISLSLQFLVVLTHIRPSFLITFRLEEFIWTFSAIHNKPFFKTIFSSSNFNLFTPSK